MVFALAGMACTESPRTDRFPVSENSAEPGPTDGSLADIMQHLGTDMASTATGIWMADAAQVAIAAQRIADHPPVSPEDRAKIQAVLGQRFATFVAFDQEVHGAAIELVDAAAGERPIPDLLAHYSRIQEGCVACHEAFRTEVASALASGAR